MKKPKQKQEQNESQPLNRIDEALKKAAHIPAREESLEYGKRLVATLRESGLSSLVIDGGGANNHAWAYDRSEPKIDHPWKIELTFADGYDASVYDASVGKSYGAVWSGWATQLVNSYYQLRFEHHYKLAQEKLLAAACILP